MRPQRIVVVDSDPLSYQVVQNCFYAQSVEILWLKSVVASVDMFEDATIILLALEGENSYDSIAEISRRYPRAVLFILSADRARYNSFEARNAGVVGAFFKPLHFDAVQSRLEEFLHLEDLSTDHLVIPPIKERRASLLSFYRDAPQDIEDLLQDCLPVLVEKIVQLELQTNGQIKRLISTLVAECVRDELKKYSAPSDEGGSAC